MRVSHLAGSDSRTAGHIVQLYLRVQINRKLELEAEVGLEPRHSIKGCGSFKIYLNMF